MTDALVIVFVKNIKLGTVKTRLAKTIGDFGAFEVYSELVKITEQATAQLDVDKRIYFSNALVDAQWKDVYKTVQHGADLGERMLNAFKEGFEAGYKKIVLIGSDLPDINETYITKGIEALNEKDVVFGPAEDGGYYLIGLSKIEESIFMNKPWSQSNLLNETLQELHRLNVSVGILEPLNDIDTYEDLIASEFYKSNLKLQEKYSSLMIKYITESTEYLQSKGFETPEVGIILGTGLGQLIDEIEILAEASYNHIPNFPTATVEFHKGKLVYGLLAGKKVVVMQGRFHVYEGYTLRDVSFPVRIMEKLGIKTLLVSNAAGAINLDFKKGELMLIDDHINLQGGSPLAFKGVSNLGERFTDMSAPYDADINRKFESIAKENNIKLHKGVYASVVGPQLETRAEYRMLKIIGADAVGMSTVPEVIVANHLNLKVAAVSVITDECDPNSLKPVDIGEIIAMAGKAEPNMITLFKELIKNL